ncbi:MULTISPECIES: ABC transporter substrate-binding protein [unclassified Symbiopectobacterium]|uniref:ABC transporter substrate-binding protein n=2 Tax=Symbiopectobacterium TaxID=801 RepID=UPI002226DED9|nr:MULTISPECIES: ABC transporter substrate-binding protein [unclassified Symbiopectobacterium]MCW2474194.1 ABC transporter substrate-binding protein [Candidatus Symbiopectobacterium sp. NZEC151]MCW2485431.1 ABC transporter substrate-binding protein [Candidatus Symbiopectobacterium sp. NZEC127]
MKRLLVVFALLAGLLPQLSFANGKVRIGYWTSGVSLGYGAVLESQDFLKKRGVDAEFVHFPDVNAPLKALASGSIDLAFGAPVAGVFSVASEGVPVKIIAATQPADVAFVVPADSPITSLSQLKGKKVGMSPAGSSVAVIGTTLLQENAGIAANAFSLVGGNESRLAQFLAQKQVDAAALRTLTVKQLPDLKLRVISTYADEWKKLTHSDAQPYIGVGTVRNELLTQQPETVAKVIAALRDTLDWGRAHPDDVVNILKVKASLPEDQARAYVSLWDRMNQMSFETADIDTLKREHAVLLGSGSIKGELNNDLFDQRPYLASKKLK